MNRAETAEAIEVMQAWLDGEAVQFRQRDNAKWCGFYLRHNAAVWDWDRYEYRIKPTPKVVPWTAETFPKDRPVWVCRRTRDGFGNYWDRGIACMVVCTGAVGVNIFVASEPRAVQEKLSYAELAEFWMQHDGSPCGTVEEQQ